MNTKIYALLLALLLSCSIHAQDQPQPATDSIEILGDANYGLSIVKRLSDEQYGLMDSAGNFLVPPQYDYIFPFFEELALVYHNDVCGYLNLEGQIEIPFDYTTGTHFINGKAVVTKDFVSGVIDRSNKVVIPFEYDGLKTHDHSTYAFKFKPKEAGIMDSQGKVLVEPTYEGFIKSKGAYWVGRKNKKFIILKNNGERHTPGEFDQIGFKNKANAMRFSVDKKVGFFDENFNIIIPAQYSGSGPAMGELIALRKDGKWGFVDKSNTAKTAFIYDGVKGLNGESCIVIKDGKSNILDKNGNLKLQEDRDYITAVDRCDLVFMDGHLYDRNLKQKTSSKVRLAHEQFDGMMHGRMKIYVNNKLGYIDSVANMKIPALYDTGHHFYEEGCTAVMKEGKWGFIKSDGAPITAMTYDEVYHFGSFSNCNYLIVKDSLYGCFLEDQVVFEPQFQEILPDEGQHLVYRQAGKYGILDVQTLKINAAVYDKIISRWAGFEVEKAGQFGFLDKSLNIIIPIEYEYLQTSGDFLIAKSGGKYGTISESNEIIHDFVYDNIEIRPLEAVKVYKEGKVGVLSSAGTELLPPIYDKIKQLNWRTIEVSIGEESEIINLAKLENEQVRKDSKK